MRRAQYSCRMPCVRKEQFGASSAYGTNYGVAVISFRLHDLVEVIHLLLVLLVVGVVGEAFLRVIIGRRAAETAVIATPH